MTTFTVSLSAHDRANNRYLYLKADGRRFGSSQTVKIGADVKYDVTVTVKPSVQTLDELVLGGDSLTPDSSTKNDDSTTYNFTWLTNGFRATSSGKRNDLRCCFKFDGAELATNFQVKFYGLGSASHLTWGTPIRNIELEAKIQKDGAVPFQNLIPSKVNFR